MKSRYIIALVLLVLGYLLIGGTAPYRKNPEVSEEYKENFAEKDFYGTGEGPDRAKVIIDLAKHENVQIKIYSRVNLLLPWKGVSRLHSRYNVIMQLLL